ncbi:hypothetical protein ACC680_35980, partial [Rhizobium ruizarguesonis]
MKPLFIEEIHRNATSGLEAKRNTNETAFPFHNVDYATLACSRKVEVSCFCRVGMSLSPGLMTVE